MTPIDGSPMICEEEWSLRVVGAKPWLIKRSTLVSLMGELEDMGLVDTLSLVVLGLRVYQALSVVGHGLLWMK